MYKALEKETDAVAREKIIDEIQRSTQREFVYRSGVFKELRKVQIGKDVKFLSKGTGQICTLMAKTKTHSTFSFNGSTDLIFSMKDGTALLVSKESAGHAPGKRIKDELWRRALSGVVCFNDGKVIPYLPGENFYDKN